MSTELEATVHWFAIGLFLFLVVVVLNRYFYFDRIIYLEEGVPIAATIFLYALLWPVLLSFIIFAPIALLFEWIRYRNGKGSRVKLKSYAAKKYRKHRRSAIRYS